jgi:hypothetical protein
LPVGRDVTRARLEVPTELVWLHGRPVVALRELDDGDIQEPFWHHTLKRTVGRPRLLPLDRADDPPVGWRPAGSIFHMQRCGSTLACRLLGAIPGVVALSEPMIFQSLLTGGGAPEERRRWLRRLMALHAGGLGAGGSALVIKWSSLLIAFEPEIAAAFAGMPAVFMYRDPLEVLVSSVDDPPGNARLVFPAFFGPSTPLTAADIAGMPFDELCARIHAACLDHARHATSLRLLDYAALPDAVWNRMAPYFGIGHPSGAVAEMLRQRAAFDAKTPARRFAADGVAKRARATPRLRELAERLGAPALARLATVHRSL